MILNSEEVTNNLRNKIEKWKNSLADLTKNNPLIQFRTHKRTLEITNNIDTIYTDIRREKKVLFFDVESPEGGRIKSVVNELTTVQTSNEKLKILKNLTKASRQSLEETGVNILFLAFGTLSWEDEDKSTKLLSPLTLVPVSLSKERKKGFYKLSPICEDEEASIIINPALCLKLKKFDINLSEIKPQNSYRDLINIIKDRVLHQYPSWEVQDGLFLSLFSYANIAMVEDFNKYEKRIFDHPMLQSLSGGITEIPHINDILQNSIKDSQVKPQNIFQVLDADSSQQVVIEAAKRGDSFVVQGPPGTGKSQTIVNMITELIGAGKSVLLVAAKDTAVKVVYDRLSKCGLEHLCLNLHHSQAMNNKEVIQELLKTITSTNSSFDTSKHQNFFDELLSSREHINSYPVDLHTKHQPLDRSLFELYGELLKKKRADLPNYNVRFPNYESWSTQELNIANSLLKQLGSLSELFYENTNSIWSQSFTSDDFSAAQKMNLEQIISNLQQGIDSARELETELKLIFNNDYILHNIDSIEFSYNALCHLLKVTEINLPNNWVTIDIDKERASIEHYKSSLKIINDPQNTLIRERYSEEFFSLNLFELSQRYENYAKKCWILNMLDPVYRKDMNLLAKLNSDRKSHSFHQFRQDLLKALKIQSIENNLDQDYTDNKSLGSFLSLSNLQNMTEVEVELEKFEQLLNWVNELDKYCLSRENVDAIQQSVFNLNNVIEKVHNLKSIKDEIDCGLDFLFNQRQLNHIYTRENIKQVDLKKVEEFLKLASLDLDKLSEWFLCQKICRELEKLGCESFLQLLRKNKDILSQDWFTILEKLIYEAHIQGILFKQPGLRLFNSQSHQDDINNFKKLDVQQLQIAQIRLRLSHAQRWQTFEVNPDNSLQIQNLGKEQKKKRKYLPIRKLLNDKNQGIKSVIKTLKPCWMMSPIAVTKYIDPDETIFDVLIFDEASQLRTEQVISSIIRAKQVIIIGDTKQLPPTSFFMATEEEEDTEEDAPENLSFDSILDECSVFLRQLTLKWHYRSQDERLIAFSNYHFYDSRLVTFPNAIKSKKLGVEFKYIEDGIYQRSDTRINLKEAQTIAELALEHVKTNPQESLGIIAFSQSQTNAIEQELEKLYKANPDLQDFCENDSTQFFLKSLENIQGNEKDIILLSVGYGKDSVGKFTLNFGPLNKAGGERRLNVAITRAKNKLILVSSITAGDIDPTRVNSQGGRLLREYLQYVESGGNFLSGNSFTESLKFDSPFEEDVYMSICHHPELKDYNAYTQVGCSDYRIDLAIVHKDRPGEFVLGIECDGASYHSSLTARDRDRLRQEQLEKLGWKIYRIWSTEWFHNKGSQVQLLVEKIKSLRNVQ